jgi:hypothetical protein
MFDQAIFNSSEKAEPLHEGDLFYNYEIRGWQPSRRIYSIIGVSIILNLLFIAVIGQTNVLTARGCDSPFVGRVCQVLDMAYVGSVLFGTDREYIDAAYNKMDLKDAEVVWIDQTGVESLFKYPDGYFQLANPESKNGNEPYPNADTMNPGYLAPGIPSNPIIAGRSLIDTPPVIPKSKKNPVKGKLPDSPFSLPGDETASNNANNNSNAAASNNPKPDANVTGNSNADTPVANPSAPLNAVEINKRPIIDLGNMVNEMLARNEVDLQSEFIGNAKGKLTKDGRIDPKTLKLQIESPDADMQRIIQEGILAIDAAGYLQYLNLLSGHDFDLVLKQDAETISAVIQSEMESERRADSTRRSLDLALAAAKVAKSGSNADQNDKDDLILLENAKVESNGKKVIIRFVVPKSVVHPMIQRKLAEQAAEMKKPSGSTAAPKLDGTAVK